MEKLQIKIILFKKNWKVEQFFAFLDTYRYSYEHFCSLTVQNIWNLKLSTVRYLFLHKHTISRWYKLKGNERIFAFACRYWNEATIFESNLSTIFISIFRESSKYVIPLATEFSAVAKPARYINFHPISQFPRAASGLCLAFVWTIFLATGRNGSNLTLFDEN